MFAARFDAPVLVYKREVTADDFVERTFTKTDSESIRRVEQALELKSLQLRREAHDVRLIRLSTGRITLGRTSDNDVAVPHRLVSAQHASVIYEDGRVSVLDAGSKNGT